MNLKNKFTYKILFVLGIVLFILFNILISNSFGFQVNNDGNYVELADLPFDENDENSHFVILYKNYGINNSTNYYYLFYCNNSNFDKFVCQPGSYINAFDKNGNQIGYDSRTLYLSDYNMSGNSWGDLRRWGTVNIGQSYFVYASDAVYDLNGNLYYDATKVKDAFYCIPDKEYIDINTFKFSQIISIQYSGEFYNNYDAYISVDGKNWETMQKEIYDPTNDNSTFSFYSDVFENGTYQVRLFDSSSGKYIYEGNVEVDNIPFEITLEPSENTDKPVVAKSNVFSFEGAMKYLVSFSTDKTEWKDMNQSLVEPNEENPPTFGDAYFWTRIFKNGTYYFRFTYFDEEYEGDTLISATPVHFYVKKEINNLLVEDYMSDDYIFKPIISLDFNEEKQSFIVRTQSILLDKALNLNCFYISYEKQEGFDPNNPGTEENITGWNKMEIDFENNIYMNTADAYFYFEIPIINAQDTSYKIAFYNYFSNKSSEIVYYDFVYENAKNYVENELKVHLGINIYLNDLLKNFENRLGVLGFPITIVRQFSNRILTLQSKQPIIYIPELRDPFYNNKIFSGVSFNFNSLLVSDNVIFIHEFYLIVIDIIFIYLFLRFCIKTLKSFIDKS